MRNVTALNHWILDGRLMAYQFDRICNLTFLFGPLRKVFGSSPDDAAFYALLTGDINSLVGGIFGTYERTGSAVLRSPAIGRLALVAQDVSRHEYLDNAALGMAFERASTNKCLNANANPDAALGNIELGGDSSAVLRRTNNLEALKSAGLELVCTDGNIIELDNSAGTANAWIFFEGVSGTLNTHTGSAYVQGTGNGALLIEGAPIDLADLPGAFERVTTKDVPATVNSRLAFYVGPGAVGQIILNQFEEQPFATSVIVTENGVSTSRDQDLLTYPEFDDSDEPLLNQEQGVVACRISFSADALNARYGGTANNNVIAFAASTWVNLSAPPAGQPVQIGITAQTQTGGNISAEVHLDDVIANQEIVVAGRWNRAASILQVGAKVAGAWRWSPEVADYHAYDHASSFRCLNNWQSCNHRDLSIWRIDQGREWIEQFFSGVAQ